MIWHLRRPDIIIGAIEKCLSLIRACILVDISLDSDIFLRGECSSIPLPATRIGCEISVKEMIVEPLTRCLPVSSAHIARDPCDIHTQMVMHISCLIEGLYPEVDRLDTSSRIHECYRHIMCEDILLIEPDIHHHPIGPESLPYTEEELSPSELLQELLDLMRLIPSREYSSADIRYRDESSRYIRRKLGHMTCKIVAISAICYWIDRIDHSLDTRSVSRECIVWDFHSDSLCHSCEGRNLELLRNI
jgi:hypothetical protein